MVTFFARVRAFFGARRLDRDLDREMEAHLELLADENVRRGMTRERALYEARLTLGGRESLKEQHREVRGLPFFDTLLQDLRYTFRTLGRDAGFTAFAILIVGLGIGASATVFSVVNALILQPLPFHDAHRLVWISNIADDGVSEWNTQSGHVIELREQNKSFSGIAGFFGYSSTGDTKLTGDGEPERLNGVQVTENFFPLLGIEPMLGRSFNADECKWNGPPVVLLSYRLWKNRFQSDPQMAGRKLTLNDAPFTVVGVLPESFDFATVFAPGGRSDIYFPFPVSPETSRWGNTLSLIGRLNPGATVASARAEFTILGKRLTDEHPKMNTLRPKLAPLEEHVSGRIRPALIVLACAVGVVMLIVCANLSNLLLARTSTRQKEMAIRAALGAGRGRLIRQMLTESLVLSCCGALLGLLLAIAGTRSLAHLNAFNIPLLERIHVDGAALGFTLLIALITGLIFGMVPALEAPSGAVQDSLKENGRGTSRGRGHAWIRKSLVVSEVGFACVLLVGAGLLIRSFVRVLDVNLGFQPERAAAMRADPGRQFKTREQRNAFFDEALRLVRAIPGITDAGLTDVLPLETERSWGIKGKGQIFKGDHLPETFIRVVSDGYLQSVGIALKAGRDFSPQDTPSSELVVMVNETLARTLWPGENPIGQIIDQDKGRRVIGVVSDVRHRALEEVAGCEMYLPLRQTDDYSAVELVVRTSLPPSTLASAVRAELKPLDPTLPSNEFRTLQALVDKSVSPRRLVVILLVGFTLFAVVLASLGIYAVISYSVTQRTQELGIRMALGASAKDLEARIVLQTLGLVGIGMALGIAASWMVARGLDSLLFGVTASDPATFLGMIVILTLVALIAGYVPARRASRIDPMIALRAN